MNWISSTRNRLTFLYFVRNSSALFSLSDFTIWFVNSSPFI